MSRRWVVNASPLILLGKIGYIALLGKLSDELIVPAGVAREVGAKPGGERVLAEVVSLPGTRMQAEVPISSELAAWDLGEESPRFSPSRPPRAAALSSMILQHDAALSPSACR
jgi:hypothetical protein